MSSADSSPGTYLGNFAAGKIDNNEMPATIKNAPRNARSRAPSLIATASSTCSGVAEVLPSTLLSLSLVTKSTSSKRTWVLSSTGSSDRLKAEVRNTPSSPTATTLANAAPSAFETLFATPRNAPTSPASRLGDADTSTLNSSVSSVPSPIPTRSRPRMTATVLQSVADGEGDRHQTDRNQDKRGDTKTAWREAVVEPHRENACCRYCNRVREDCHSR